MTMTELAFSRREVEVIELLAEGCAFNEIGERMEISPRTARAYAESARKKLGIKESRELPRAFMDATGINPFPA